MIFFFCLYSFKRGVATDSVEELFLFGLPSVIFRVVDSAARMREQQQVKVKLTQLSP